jgi:hypothetical protein
MDALLSTLQAHLTATNLEVGAVLAVFLLCGVILLRPILGWYFKVDDLIDELEAIRDQLQILTSLTRSQRQPAIIRLENEALAKPQTEALPRSQMEHSTRPLVEPPARHQPQEIPWEERVIQRHHSEPITRRPVSLPPEPITLASAQPAAFEEVVEPRAKKRPCPLPDL